MRGKGKREKRRRGEGRRGKRRRGKFGQREIHKEFLRVEDVMCLKNAQMSG